MYEYASARVLRFFRVGDIVSFKFCKILFKWNDCVLFWLVKILFCELWEFWFVVGECVFWRLWMIFFVVLWKFSGMDLLFREFCFGVVVNCGVFLNFIVVFFWILFNFLSCLMFIIVGLVFKVVCRDMTILWRIWNSASRRSAMWKFCLVVFYFWCEYVILVMCRNFVVNFWSFEFCMSLWMFF